VPRVGYASHARLSERHQMRRAWDIDPIRGCMRGFRCTSHGYTSSNYPFVDIGYLLTTVFFQALSWVATCVSWAPALNLRVNPIRDPFGLALDTASADILLKSNLIGTRNKVSSWPLMGVRFLSSLPLDISHTLFTPHHFHR
jgi:hypothetical protein